MSPLLPPDIIDEAIAARRWETARRLALASLDQPGLPTELINRRLRQLHEAYHHQGDFNSARAALDRIRPGTAEEQCELALAVALDLGHRAKLTFYRDSDESKAGLTYEIYEEKIREKAREHIDYVLNDGSTSEQKSRARILLEAICETHEGLSLEHALKAKTTPASVVVPQPVPLTGSVAGTVRMEDGSPAAGVTVTLGLKFERPFPDPSIALVRDMGGVPDIGPIYAQTTLTNGEGRYRFDDVPADRHEFLAVTLDPSRHDIPTRFLQHGVDVAVGAVTSADLAIAEWKSAPPREIPSPFPAKLERDGCTWHLVTELVLKNPFHFDFPRQAVTISGPSKTDGNPPALLLLSSAEGNRPQPFQRCDDGITFFASLPQLSDRIFALYQTGGTVPQHEVHPDLVLTPNDDGKSAVIDTGAASFRIAFGEGTDVVAPLLSVCGVDRVWRGEGRIKLPKDVTLKHRRTHILESGPLVLTVRLDYFLSNNSVYSWKLTAHRDEAYLLVHEILPDIEGASFDFSLREFSGGRGYLHWCAEGDTKHWTDLKAEERELARIQESVAWWLPPQGFAYGMAPKHFAQRDFIAVFSRRRGEWIDRKFASVTQGTGDNRELDWPFPEMVGSTVSMITARTDPSGDAYFHFGFFDGERQWGILVSDVEKNDGPFKELSAVQHKNSSPRLQEYKDWRLDEQDKIDRPFVLAHREDLRTLRAKKSDPLFAPFWKQIADGPDQGGPSEAVLFAIDNNPLAAWRKKAELLYAAQIRSKMILLGRDFGDCYSPVGARPVAPWAESYDLIAASGCFTPDEERLVRQFFVLMGHMHMEPDLMNWKFNSRNANFEADRTDLVGTIGLSFLGHPDSDRFISHCVGLTEKSLNVYCTPGSGRWYENPACYYLHAAKCRMNLLFHLYRHGLFDATTIPRLKDFLRWGVLLLMPPTPSSYDQMRDGVPGDKYFAQHRVRRLPPIGDHARIGPWVPDHYALAARMYRETDPEFSDTLLATFLEGGQNGGHYGNPALIFCALSDDDLRPSQLAPMPSRKLEGFGAVFREHMGTDREFYLLLKQGPGGYRYHRTEGSLILFAHGRPLLYEGGEAGDTWRHSTLSFYDVEMPLAVGHVERFHDLPGLGFVQGVHPLAIKPGDPIYLNDLASCSAVDMAHARFNEPDPVDLRSVVNVRDEYVVMHDDLHLTAEIPCRWHLQVVANEHTGEAASGYLFRGRFGIDLQVLLPGQDFVAEKVEHLPIHDHKPAPQEPVSLKAGGYFHSRQPRNVIRPAAESFATRHLMVQATSPTHYLAVLRPLADGRGKVEARALSCDGRNAGVAVRGENIDDHIFLGRDSFSLTTDGVHFDGRYGAVLRRADVTHLSLLAGTSLQAAGLRLVSDGPSIHLEIKSGHVELIAEGAGHVEIHGLPQVVRLDLEGPRYSAHFPTA